MKKLILASTSPYRKQLMLDAGYRIETMASGLDESSFKNQALSPKKLAETLAEQKARSAKRALEKGGAWNNTILIGSDQVACLEDQVFDKPGNFEKAMQTLTRMSDKTHQLITSVYLLSEEQFSIFTNVTELKMKPLTKTQIEAYLRTDDPYDCAGSYKLEKAGIRLFQEIKSDDFTAIQGLPMIRLSYELSLFEPAFLF